MVRFEFIHKLFDQRQFEKIATDVFMKFYMCIEDETDSFWIWFEASGGGDIGTTPLNVTYIDFCKNKPECQNALEEYILDKLYIENSTSKDIIKKESFNDYEKAEQFKNQALLDIETFISSFPSTSWLNDKPYILEELKKINTAILSSIVVVKSNVANVKNSKSKTLAATKQINSKCFESRLTDNHLNKIFGLIKELNLFEDPFEFSDLKNLFFCTLTNPLKVNSNETLTLLFNYLQPEFITPKWQSVIDKNECLTGSMGALITAKNLSASLSGANRKSEISKKIARVISNLNTPN